MGGFDSSSTAFFYGLWMTSLLKCPNMLWLCPLAPWVKRGKRDTFALFVPAEAMPGLF